VIYQICRALLKLIYATLIRLEARGMDNIPASGPVLLCSNHISLLDPTTVGVKVNRRIHYMAKAELFKFAPIGAFLKAVGAFPVKRGGVSKESIKLALQILKDGKVMGIFPEGTTKSDSGMGKKGAAMFALRSGATVVPVAIIGSYRLFGKIKIVYGPPVDLTHFIQSSSASDVLDLATDKIMGSIRELVSRNG
jgi:1-acyl-sn-glycerol-3-phosphate acyltransferase